MVKKRHFLRRILSAKTKHNYDFFYIFESKTTFLSAWIHILRVRTKQKTLFSTFFDPKKDIFEWSSQHFRRKNAKKRDFLHFWLKDDIFEWLNLHFRCKNHAKKYYSLHFSVKNDIFERLNPHFRCKNQAKHIFYIFFDPKTTFLSDQIHILGVKTRNKHSFQHFWVKDEIFEWPNQF